MAGSAVDPVGNRVSLNKSNVESLPLPARGDRAYYYDAKVPGLALCVTATGKRVFYVVRRFGKKVERYRLGPYPAMTPEQARAAATVAVAQYAAGSSPHAKRKALRTGATLGELFDHFLEHHAKPRKRTWREDERQFKTHLESWRGRQLSTITTADIRRLHAHVGATAPYAANRLLSLLSTLFNMADAFGYAGSNPVRGIKRFQEQERERFLLPDELRPFFQALVDEPSETVRDFFTVCLLTGARRRNVQCMRWEDVNLDRLEWTIPASQFKNGRPMRVHLAPAVVEILKQRERMAIDAPWVFASPRSKTGHLEDPRASWSAILKRAGIKDLRMHDLRRSLGSWQAIGGASLPIIGASLGHKSLSATKVYARLTADPVAASVNKAADAMLATAGLARPLRSTTAAE